MHLLEKYTFEVELLENPKYYLAIAAIFRNEDRFLKEWIEFYRLLGVEKFYLYNHLSTDNYFKILKQYIEEDVVELFDLTHEANTPQDWIQLQCNVYLNAVQKTKHIVEWLIIVDSDEFLFPVKANKLTQVLKNYDDFASVSVNWRIFGSGNVNKIEKDDLLIEKLVMKESYQEDPSVKTIVKPRYVETFINPHFAILKTGYAQVIEDFSFLYGPHSHSRSNNILAINHYWARDWDFFNNTKLSRVHLINKFLSQEDKNIKTNKLIENNKKYSAEFDDAILRFVPHLKAQIFQRSYNNIEKMVKASILGEYNQIEQLLSFDIDINMDYKGITAIYGAVENQHSDIVKLLLEKGANTEIRASNGATPLYIAIQNNDSIITELLVNNGADIEASFQNISTPLELANIYGYNHLIEIMLHH